MNASFDDDRELPGDKGQRCASCGISFKYQYLYDDHLPCRAQRKLDPTTASIDASNADRDQFRAEVTRLERALVAAYTQIEVLEAERGRLTKFSEEAFSCGYDQAVREVRDNFNKQGQAAVVTEIDKTWNDEEAYGAGTKD